MRVLHVSTALSWRGGEQQLAYLQEELQKLGVEQAIACAKGGEMHRFCERQNIPHHAIAKRTSFNPFFGRKLAQIVKKRKIDILHPHDSHAHSFAVMAASLFGMQGPIVLHRRVDYPVRNSAASRKKYNHPQIQKIICVSHEVKRILDQSLDDTSKSVVVHSGIDIEKFVLPEENLLREEYQIDASKKLIGNVAAVTQQKDYFTFVETAKLLLERRKDVHFFIIGTGDQLEEIKNLVAKYNLSGSFTFTGFRKDIPQVLPCLDMLLFTSEKEGLGTTLLDAFAAKVAVVSTNAGGIRELIDHEESGYMADVGDAESLAGFAEKLLNNSELRADFVAKAFRKVQAFDKAEMAKKVLRIYREVLQKQ